MRIIKCDECKADLTGLNHYSIGSIEFNIPGRKTMRLHLSGEDHQSNSQITTKEAWIDYCDLEFCESCFHNTGFSKYTKEQDAK